MNHTISLSNEDNPLLFKQKSAVAWRFVVLFIFSIVLMMYDHRSSQTEKLRSSMMTFAAPLQFSVSTPMEFLAWIKDNFLTHQQLTTENATLKSQLLLQEAQLQKIIALEKENKQLRALLRSTSTVNESVKVAKILAISLEPFLAQVVLDKGKNYGVYIGEPVLDSTGVMGQVIQVGDLTSRVMLVSDSRSAVPIQDSRTGVRAIAVGRGPTELLTLINLPATSEIYVGDSLVTSGFGLNFPAGYPVGIVTKVGRIPGQYFASVEVKPSANLDKSRQVLLLMTKEGPEYREAKEQMEAISKENAQEQGISQTLSNTNL